MTDFSAHDAVEAAYAEHGVEDTAPEPRPAGDPNELETLVHDAYDQAQAKATAREYEENYHTVAGAQGREDKRADARADAAEAGADFGLSTKYGEYVAQRGMSIPEAVGQLMTSDHAIHSAPFTAKKALLARLVNSYGIDPRELSGLSPQAAQMAIEEHGANLSNAHAQMDQANAQAEIDRVKSAKHQNGDPQYPFFSELEPAMTRIAMADTELGRGSPSITDLYQRAALANPQVQQRLDHIGHAKAAWKVEQASRLKRAKAAGSSITGSGGVAEPEPRHANSTAGDMVREAMELHGA